MMLVMDDELAGTVVIAVITVLLVVRAAGYAGEPWWCRWTAVAGAGVFWVADAAGFGVVSVVGAAVFVAGLIVHLGWKSGNPDAKWSLRRGD